MLNTKISTIYWSPTPFHELDWNMLYPDPKSLFDKVCSVKAQSAQNFIYCPAFADVAKNTFLLKNPLTSAFDITDARGAVAKSKNFVGCTINPESSLEGCKIIKYDLKWIFFTEDDIEMTVTSPYFESSAHLKYGNLVPGKMNISKWFRNINLEYNLHRGVNEFCVEQDETLAYVNFATNNRIKLVRFEMTPKLYSIMGSTATSSMWESWVPLVARYKRFMETRTNKIVLNEIKRNLV